MILEETGLSAYYIAQGTPPEDAGVRSFPGGPAPGVHAAGALHSRRSASVNTSGKLDLRRASLPRGTGRGAGGGAAQRT